MSHLYMKVLYNNSEIKDGIFLTPMETQIYFSKK